MLGSAVKPGRTETVIQERMVVAVTSVRPLEVIDMVMRVSRRSSALSEMSAWSGRTMHLHFTYRCQVS
jgi:hypothetical protein